jgi:phage gp36-like protein
MPRYASVDDLRARLNDAKIEITATSVPTAAQVESLLDQVEAEVHAYLRNRYRLPITDAEAVVALRGWVVSLACERVFALAYPQAVANPFSAEARAARELLRALARGEASLPRSDAPAPNVVVELPEGEPEFRTGRRL